MNLKRPSKHTLSGTNGCGSCRLSVQDLCVTKDAEVILDHVSFHMHCGELIALIGPNGAGKSSLFKSILGQMPHSGTISYENAQGESLRPRIGYVPQSPTFDPADPMSVLDLFSTAISRWPAFLCTPRKLRERITTCLSRVNGQDMIDKRVGSLSGGELQRVLLAMALEPMPNILILDEPMSGVDVAGEEQLLELLDNIRRKYDLSILLSTHDFNTLKNVDKVILLRKRVLRQGSPLLVLSSPEFRALFPDEHHKGGRG